MCECVFVKERKRGSGASACRKIEVQEELSGWDQRSIRTPLSVDLANATGKSSRKKWVRKYPSTIDTQAHNSLWYSWEYNAIMISGHQYPSPPWISSMLWKFIQVKCHHQFYGIKFHHLMTCWVTKYSLFSYRSVSFSSSGFVSYMRQPQASNMFWETKLILTLA